MTKTDGDFAEKLLAKANDLARLRLLDELVDQAEKAQDFEAFKQMLRNRRVEAMKEE